MVEERVLLKSPTNCYDYSYIKSTAVMWEIATLASARSQRQRWCDPFPPWGKVGMGASRLQLLISKFIIAHITVAICNYYFF
jgi:hypothetical protein